MTSPFRVNPLATAFLRKAGANGIAMPWGRAYLLPHKFTDRALRRHELSHLRQMQRDGRVRFSILYLWWSARIGYWWNPYEVATRIEIGEEPELPAYRKHPILGPVLARHVPVKAPL